MTDARTIPCACGRVTIETRGAPVVTAACYCDDCQAAAALLEALPGARPVKGTDGGTEYVVFRKDRLRCTQGEALLQRHKLRESSATNRWVAGCCNSAMYVNFDDSKHWVNVYRAWVPGEKPPLEMRVSTRFKPAGAKIPDGVPQYPGYPFKFIAKLLGARFAMLLGA